MAVHFQPLKVKKIVHETPECVSVSFQIPSELQDDFKFREGQNITIRLRTGVEDIRRSYSICAAPHEKELKIAVKKVHGGTFSSFINDELKVGDTLDVLPPTGKFNAKLGEKKDEQFLAIAAGSGITPVISIIKHTLIERPESKFTLLYANRNRQSIIFFNELEAMKNKYMRRFQMINILSREAMDNPLFSGRINTEKLQRLKILLSFHDFDQTYICGPEAMIFTIRDFLKSEGYPEERIHFELFTIPGEKKTSSAVKEEKKISGPVSHVKVHIDDRTIEFDLPMNGQSILEAALEQGADLPYSCKGGVCATCRAKLEEGEVEMDQNYALEKEELEQGFILTCQSHPRTPTVTVNFDAR